jgi:aspartate aminotransferase
LEGANLVTRKTRPMQTSSHPTPKLSAHFEARRPSDIRMASILFAKRTDQVQAINVAIGNVSLPMHPAMQARLAALSGPDSPFKDGVVGYTATVGTQEARDTVLHLIAASGLSTQGLHAQITDGGSQAMELLILGVCGPAGSDERPLMLIDAAYTNYVAFASRLGRTTCSIVRTLGDDGKFTLPSTEAIEAAIMEHQPGALVVIPYDNPTGHFYNQQALSELARLCVKHNLWMVSDEAYRELHYTGEPAASIWAITEDQAPGILGRRISIETASKVWNACGLRIGALVTDNEDFHTRAVFENTASLCPSTLGQYVFAGLGHETPAALQAWFARQRAYYAGMLKPFAARIKELLPGVIVGNPDAALYSVIDVRAIAKPGFDANAFVEFCASRGRVSLGDEAWTLLTAPMKGFYDTPAGQANPGVTQVRVAYVETPERMALVPELFASLFHQYEDQREPSPPTR